MPRRRTTQGIDGHQLSFALAIVPLVASSRTPRVSRKQAVASARGHPAPYTIRGVFRFTNGQERDRTVDAVAPSRADIACASTRLIARMRESGWHFAEGSAILTELLETTAKEE